jgi:hypothetical protein
VQFRLPVFPAPVKLWQESVACYVDGLELLSWAFNTAKRLIKALISRFVLDDDGLAGPGDVVGLVLSKRIHYLQTMAI